MDRGTCKCTGFKGQLSIALIPYLPLIPTSRLPQHNFFLFGSVWNGLVVGFRFAYISWYANHLNDEAHQNFAARINVHSTVLGARN